MKTVHLKNNDDIEHEISVDDVYLPNVDTINNLDLRSDLENNNIYGCILVTQGYIGNRPPSCEDYYHEDDTWAIDCYCDGEPVTAYLYTSYTEYKEDVITLINSK